MVKLPGSGPLPARSRVMVVGESFGEDEEREGTPFIGKSGRLLDSLLAQVGIDRAGCYITNVVNKRPPGNKVDEWWTSNATKARKNALSFRHGDYWMNEAVVEGLAALPGEIERAAPEVVVALGNLALWALTGESGVGNWRGSEMWYVGVPVPSPWDWKFKRAKGEPAQAVATATTGAPASPLAVVPTYHPAYVMRVWEWKAPVTHDLRMRVASKIGKPLSRAEPIYNFRVPATFDEAGEYLTNLAAGIGLWDRDLVCDIETRRGRIVCAGFGWSAVDGLCIPFSHVDGTRYWTEQQEQQLSGLCRALLCDGTHPVGNQNWNYDRQYFIADPAFGFRPRMDFDTMIAQHLLLPGTPKDLAYLASMYCKHYRYWKGEGKEVEDNVDEDRWFNYNCLDAVRTWEVWQAQKKLLAKAGLR